jgi:hypothetical protein
VTVAVSFPLGSLPTNYAALVTPNQACADYVTNKTNRGFNVMLTPPSPAGVNATLAAGSFDVVVIG